MLNSKCMGVFTGISERKKIVSSHIPTELDLYAILEASGIQGLNNQATARKIYEKFDKYFLCVDEKELQTINGIGKIRALLISQAIAKNRKLYSDNQIIDALKYSHNCLSFSTVPKTQTQEKVMYFYLGEKNEIIRKNIESNSKCSSLKNVFLTAVQLQAKKIFIIHLPTHRKSKIKKYQINFTANFSLDEYKRELPLNDVLLITNRKEEAFSEELQNFGSTNSYVADKRQRKLFTTLDIEGDDLQTEREDCSEINYQIPTFSKKYFQIQNRRYIGNKFKLLNWIFSIIRKECQGKTLTDLFGGTGIISAIATKYYDNVRINDFLYSNMAIYQAFFGNDFWNSRKINDIIKEFNNIDGQDLEHNYFSLNFGGKYFSVNSAKKIGMIRENIEQNKKNLTSKEYYILIASLLYSIDKIANTVGHYDAYFKKKQIDDRFFMRAIEPVYSKNIEIYREDANLLAKQIDSDVVYIDPPYNSRQYSRFYHLLESLTKWDKSELFGVALKPKSENMSDYCRVSATEKFSELIGDLKTRYIVVSYSNTFESKSNSSRNKIKLQEIKSILTRKGDTKIFEKKYKHFNAGNTNFPDHKEYLFVTKAK